MIDFDEVEQVPTLTKRQWMDITFQDNIKNINRAMGTGYICCIDDVIKLLSSQRTKKEIINILKIRKQHKLKLQ